LSTESLRNDHKLIEKVLNALDTTISLLLEGKQIPEQILLPTIDFTKNFTHVCHHGKEEEVLFPALGQTGMPTQMGPIPRMLLEHKMTNQLAEQIEKNAKVYLESRDAQDLVSSLQNYVNHVREHLWKENNRLFMMADSRLNNISKEVHDRLEKIEQIKLDEIGKSRSEYETLADELEKSVSKI
tara:strand:- start:995 stop:1546 length:552 start_codon:yes stop_codon:yes gene_type:complete